MTHTGRATTPKQEQHHAHPTTKRRCHRVVATVLVGEGLLVRRMLTVQDRAAIAKGLQEGCSLRRTADRIVWIGVRGISRGIRRNGGKCGYQPVWQLM